MVEFKYFVYYIVFQETTYNEMEKIVLIGDIISSKKIAQRSKIQSKLKRVFKKINNDNKCLSSPLTITLGDEFQAVYNKADSIFHDIWLISLVIHPIEIRFSIGVGEITTRINRQQAIGMDGPAFYNARAGLDKLKQTSYLFNITQKDLSESDLIKQSLFLVSHLAENWKITRLKILTMLYDNLSIVEISKKIKISDKAVYKNIDAGALDIIINLTDEISRLLNELLKRK